MKVNLSIFLVLSQVLSASAEGNVLRGQKSSVVNSNTWDISTVMEYVDDHDIHISESNMQGISDGKKSNLTNSTATKPKEEPEPKTPTNSTPPTKPEEKKPNLTNTTTTKPDKAPKPKTTNSTATKPKEEPEPKTPTNSTPPTKPEEKKPNLTNTTTSKPDKTPKPKTPTKPKPKTPTKPKPKSPFRFYKMKLQKNIKNVPKICASSTYVEYMYQKKKIQGQNIVRNRFCMFYFCRGKWVLTYAKYFKALVNENGGKCGGIAFAKNNETYFAKAKWSELVIAPSGRPKRAPSTCAKKFGGAKIFGKWKVSTGRLQSISASADGKHIWGVNKDGEIWYRYGSKGRWRRVDGWKKQIAVSGDGKHVWGVNKNGQIWYRNGLRSKWRWVDGWKKQIAVSGDGRHVWGVNNHGKIYYRNGFKGKWRWVPSGRSTQIAVSGNGRLVATVTSWGDVYWRSGFKGKWRRFPHIRDVKQIEVNDRGNFVLGLLNDGKVIFAVLRPRQPIRWGLIGGPPLTQVSLGGHCGIWGVNKYGVIWHF